ncbi:MAG: beta-eliminating lyase-related protein [Hyphomonadaceae bacterium]|nr:beta-eliminating lyase-related protein [Hyphomonadaceae bacterium]
MFASDNSAPTHPQVLAALAGANAGVMASYGDDAWTARAETMLRAVFETECAVLLVPTGTAANALSLAALTPPWGAVIAHRHAHIALDEGGAPEFYTGGAKLLLIDGPSAKLTPEGLDAEARRYTRAVVHGAQPFAASISQVTESGAVYAPAEVAALAAVCRARGLKLHMDGARFANALVSAGCAPADMTWRAGVDVLSFGATKNGAMAVEAIVCFDPTAAAVLPHLRKRAGQLFSKHRYLAAQMTGYLEHGLWLTLARHANAMAAHLAVALRDAGATMIHPVDANMIFARLAPGQAAALRAAGAAFHPSAVDGVDAYRFVCSWGTTEADITTVRRALSVA